MIEQLAGIATGTALGVALALSVTAQPAHASYFDPCTTDAPTCDPSLSVEPAEPWCQWSAESGRRVLVVGKGITRASVDLGPYWDNVTSKPNNRHKLVAWVKIPKGYAEDDINLVQAKIGGEWRICESS